MRQSHKLINNAISNLIGNVSRLMAVFLLPPFVISYIGKDSYGLIVTVISITAFMNLIQIGTPNALTRFISQAIAHKDYEEASRILSTGAALLSVGGLIALAIIAAIMIDPSSIVAIPKGSSISKVRFLILIMGVVAALSLPLSLGDVIFYVKGKFALYNALQIASTTLRVALVLLLVWLFRDSKAYVLGHASALLVTMIVVLSTGLYLFKEASLAFDNINKNTLRKIMGYGIEVFIYSSVYLMFIQSDYLIIGKTLGTSSVTMFNLAAIWGISLRGVIVAVVSVAAPSASFHKAKDAADSLRIMLIRITKYALIMSIPAILYLGIFGKRIMLNWMGKGYEQVALLMIPILIGETFVIAEAGGAQIYIGLGKLRYLTVTNILFGGLNVIITLLVCTVFNFGLPAVAATYMVLLVVRSGLLTPIYMATELSIPAITFYKQSYLSPILSAIFFTPFVFLIHNLVTLSGWTGLSLAAILTTISYAPFAYWMAMDSYDREIMQQFFYNIKTKFLRRLGYDKPDVIQGL